MLQGCTRSLRLGKIFIPVVYGNSQIKKRSVPQGTDRFEGSILLQTAPIDRLHQQKLRIFLQIKDTGISVVFEFLFSHDCFTNFSAHLPAALPMISGGMNVATHANGTLDKKVGRIVDAG